MHKNIEYISLVHGLEEEIIQEISMAGVVKQYVLDEMIIWQGEDCKSVYFILSGQIEIFRLSPAGREQIFERLRAGETFNLVPAVQTTAMNPSNVRAIEPTELFILEKDALNELILRYPEIALRITRYLAQRLKYMTNLVEQLSLYTVQQRLASFLVQQADSTLPGKWTQNEIAHRLGTVREVVSRALGSFSEEGLIRMEKNQVILLDRKQLKKISNGGE
jgi:CRP-like cAMP-binding protein